MQLSENTDAAVQNATLVVKWNEAAVTLFSAAALPPPVIARAVFVTHNCLYDTWAAYNDTAIGLYWPSDFERQRKVRSGPWRAPMFPRQQREHRTAARLAHGLLSASDARASAPLAVKLPGRAQGRKSEQEAAMSYAVYRCLAFLLPTARPALDAFLTVLGYNPAAVNGTSNPAQVAKATTDAIIAVRSDDGANQANNYADTTGYQPVNTPTQARPALSCHARPPWISAHAAPAKATCCCNAWSASAVSP